MCPVTDNDSKMINFPSQAQRHCRWAHFVHFTSELFFCFFFPPPLSNHRLLSTPKRPKRFPLSASHLRSSLNHYAQEARRLKNHTCYCAFILHSSLLLPTAIISNMLLRSGLTSPYAMITALFKMLGRLCFIYLLEP